MLIETFREVAWSVESHHPADLVDSVFPACDEFACLLESPYAYEIVGSHSGVMLDVPEQESAADVHLLCNVFDRKLMVGNPVGKDLAELLHEGVLAFVVMFVVRGGGFRRCRDFCRCVRGCLLLIQQCLQRSYVFLEALAVSLSCFQHAVLVGQKRCEHRDCGK